MALLDVCIPGMCLVCGGPFRYGAEPFRELVYGCAVCPECRDACRRPTFANRCAVCSIPVPQFIQACERCRREEFSFSRAVALHRYSDVPAAVVQAFKFARHRSLGRFIGAALVPLVAEIAPGQAPLVAVPSSPRSVRSRGFAGATLIAEEIARRSGRGLLRLLRSCPSRSQKALSYEDRRENAYRAVRLDRRIIVPELVVLVDDVFTTGATADSCARRLRSGGAREVYVVTFAIEY
jgi:competence protein ComFC